MPATATSTAPIDREALVRELGRWHALLEDPAQREQLITAALPRIQALLALLPPGTRESRLLELGASPFFNTLCLELVWPGQLTLTNYGPAGQRGSQQLFAADGTPQKVYAYDLFDVEADEFPYPDGAFDVVIFSELIEHLSLNPVWTLSEIHRVLKPGGHVLITTPNALSLERLGFYLSGHSHDDDRYVPHMGAGARHNREYRPWELHELLTTTGFTVETLAVRDLVQGRLRRRLGRAAKKWLLRWWSDQPRGTHIFLRARRGDVFRWRFPPFLYAHMQIYSLVRHPFVEMGVNDAIQCTHGWLDLEERPDGRGFVRRVNGSYVHQRWLDGAGLLLRGREGANRLVVRLGAVAGAGPRVPVTVRIAPRNGAAEELGQQRLEVPTGEWRDVVVPLARATRAGEQLAASVELPEGPDEVAVQRVWLDAAR